MTTRREITEWVRPLIELHPMMVQERHLLLFSPVGHVLRAIAFWGSSNRSSPNPGWVLAPLFFGPRLMDTFGRHIPVGHSDWPGFRECLEERANEGIAQYLLPYETIEDFYNLSGDTEAHLFGDLRYLPRQQAVLLAALGQFEEAFAMLAQPLADLEQQAEAQLERGQAALAKRPDDRVGKLDIEYGERDRMLAADLKRLLTRLREGDAHGVAAILHGWERENVTKWGVGKHWQPTPFPFEEVARAP